MQRLERDTGIAVETLARISHTGDGWHKLQADFAGCGAGATEVGGAQGRGLLFIFSGSSWACW
jgi:hypothetical protein